ncbi:hypothetical protein KIPB_013101 [Kipferlia bialata]|uniref:Uncharacterized protein n=1 Tax=Kipferlia bialata TaxID=797122 RepID=A0A9K3GPE7_9EUKA|nr:hypothetical protein KIPB_013101 [Kipferlia bialata]|eukprot:g13101.t1
MVLLETPQLLCVVIDGGKGKALFKGTTQKKVCSVGRGMHCSRPLNQGTHRQQEEETYGTMMRRGAESVGALSLAALGPW